MNNIHVVKKATLTVGKKPLTLVHIAQKVKFSIKYLFSNCDQIRSFLRIWSQLLKKSLMGSYIFCAMPSALFSWFNIITNEH